MSTLPDPSSGDVSLARAVSPRGEVVLRRRGADGALELRVNGVFVMDTAETATERTLGDLAAASAVASRSAGLRVLIGGLGLGFTLAAVLASSTVGSVVVAEIEPAIIDWHLAGLIPQTARTVADPRVHLEVGDVRTVLLAQRPASLDVIVLDVDNGPGNLVYDANAALYESPFLVSCRAALAPSGRLLVWSAAESPDFEARLRSVFRRVSHTALPVTLARRFETYSLYEAGSA